MGENTGIEWADDTWNPLIGCTKVSAGCDNCYAEGEVNRRHAAAMSPKTSDKMKEAFPATFDIVSVRPDRFLEIPLRKTKPTKYFVNSLSDLFHRDVPDEVIAKVFAVMAIAGEHTFQLLTKRHDRMRTLVGSDRFRDLVDGAMTDRGAHIETEDVGWPLPNLWLGVSVENQQWANARVPALLGTPAAVHWISAEPLLGPVDLRMLPFPTWTGMRRSDMRINAVAGRYGGLHPSGEGYLWTEPAGGKLDWIVVGGESGPGSRRLDPGWITSLRDQAHRFDVPFFFKQTGEVLAKEWMLKAKKGDDPAEWPGGMPQEYPTIGAAA